MPESFDPDMFAGVVFFLPPGLPAELHGDPVIGGETAGGTGYPAYCEPYGRGGGRNETHRQPEGASIWYVFTPSDPAAGVDWLCSWNGRLLRVTAPSATADGWALWRTTCEEVI